jgi:hypothetical protein
MLADGGRRGVAAVPAISGAQEWERGGMIYVVAEIKSGDPPNCAWEIVGVFSSAALAVEHCLGPLYCVMPMDLDVAAPTQTTPIGYYPRNPHDERYVG